MSNDGHGGRKLSVARELMLVVASMEALRLVAQQKLSGACHDEKAHHLAAVVAGGLHVLGDRIRLVEGILLNAANPALILCPENEARPSEEGPGIVREWSPQEEEEHLVDELRCARWRRSLARTSDPKKPNPDENN